MENLPLGVTRLTGETVLMRMKTWIPFVFVACVCGTAIAQPKIFSTFDEDDEGWTVIQSGEIEYKDDGGNPGGFLRVNDVPVPPDDYLLIAPEKFLGEQLGMLGGSISWDARVIEGDLFDWIGAYGKVTLVSGELEATYDPVPPGVISANWKTYKGVLSAANFGLSDEQFEQMMGNLTEIRLRLEAIDGEDAMGFDNFILSRCEADVNEDMKVDILDFVQFQLDWQAQDPDADINSDGVFNILDFVTFQLIFQEGCGF